MRTKAKSLIAVIIAVIMVLSLGLLAACGGDKDEKKATLSLDIETKSIKVGESFTLVATRTNTEESVTFASDKIDIATVDGDGKVVAVAVGTAVVTAKAGADLSATCTITVTAPDPVPPAALAWKDPTETFKVVSDVVKNRADRIEALENKVAGLVTASRGDENVPAIINDFGTFAIDETTGLYAVGEHTITFATQDGDKHELVIEVVDAATNNYYLFGKNSADYALPEVPGNANWKGGTGIRVAHDHYAEIKNGDSGLPASFVNAENQKLKDFDDPILVKNNSGGDIAFKVNDVSGVHILMSANGFVKMMFEGIQNNQWTETNNGLAPATAFGSQDIVMANGDFYFVLGNTETGNWYEKYESSASEKHWKDGRFVARNTIGGVRYGNIALIKKGDMALTTAYANQMPYVTNGTNQIEIFSWTAEITDAMLLEGIKVFDDKITENTAVYEKDVQIANSEISVAKPTDWGTGGNYTVGVYDVTFTLADNLDQANEAMKLTFTRKVKISTPADYLSYTDRNNVAKYFVASSIKENQTSEQIGGMTAAVRNVTLLAYNTSFAGNKRADVNWNSIVVYDATGKVKAYIDANAQKLHKMNADGTAIVETTGAAQNQLQYFKLNDADTAHSEAYVLQEGDTLYFGFHTGTANNLRDFVTGLTSEIINKTGVTLEAKTVPFVITGYTS